MNSLLFGIILSAIFSSTSLIAVLMRVSPLTDPAQAVPAFFVSLFLTISTVSSIAFMGMWKAIPFHAWDTGKLVSISLRQGIFLGSALAIIMLFHLLNMLNWWIGLLIAAVFLLVEMAMEH